MIPYGRQDIQPSDIAAVTKVLESDFLTQGPVITSFEKAVAEKVGAMHAVACNSATSALHLACLALDVGVGDVVWTSPNTFVASANCALYCGAEIDFVDIDPETFNMSVEALLKKLTAAEAAGRLPKVVIPVHFAGQSCDMAAIYDISLKFGFSIIEDASHAIGGQYRDSYVGRCCYSDITVFSFHPVKIITSAEGGMALTGAEGLANRLRRLRQHGITRDATEMVDEPHGGWYYEQVDLGFNYRMTELQAALGASQLLRLDDYVVRRAELAHKYDAELAQMTVHLPCEQIEVRSAWHLYVVRVDPVCRAKIFNALRSDGIGVNVHYIPVHLQPFYQRRGFVRGDFPVAEAYYASAISIPLFPGLTQEDQRYVVQRIARALDK